LFSWPEGVGRAAGWVVQSRGYNSLPAAAADQHTAESWGGEWDQSGGWAWWA